MKLATSPEIIRSPLSLIPYRVIWSLKEFMQDELELTIRDEIERDRWEAGCLKFGGAV